MLLDLKNKMQARLWQVLFLVLGTSWLWATYLNPGLSYRSSLISQYETPFQPYSWLFRLCDLLAGLLLLVAARSFLWNPKARLAGMLLAVISAGLVLDPVLSTNCRVTADVCQEYFSWGFVFHGTETIVTATFIFALSIYDMRQRRKVVSIAFVLFQAAYGLLFLTQLADHEHFNTVSQFIYQSSLIVWLAWYVRDYWEREISEMVESRPVRVVAAGWALINGVVAILVSLAHLNLVGRIKGVYFTSNNAWLAQHGAVIGVVMLYLSRHLLRGERRARQIFLLIIGIEAIKYSVVTPNAGLLAFYLVTFVALFIVRDSFNRGATPLTWRLRLKDLAFMVGGLLLATFAALVAVDQDNRASIITSRAIDNFSDYIAAHGHAPKNRLSAVLLAHSISAFILAAAISILWILFRPNKLGIKRGKDYAQIKKLLSKYSSSSEDFFKLWPKDKNYYWNKAKDGFVAYRVVGSTAFGLADPIGKNRGALVKEFNEWCHSRSLKTCFLPVYEASEKIYQAAGLELLQIGSSAEITIDDFLGTTINDKWWRWKLNRAKKDGYSYAKSTPPHSRELMKQLKAISEAWLQLGGHAERGFALGYYDQQYLNNCRLHYLVDRAGKVAAFTNELPQFNVAHIITIDLLRYAPAAQNSMPFLLASVIEDAQQRRSNIRIFDLGFVPFAKSSGPLLSIAKAFSRDRFSSRGLEQFKNKFNPDWRPNYLAYDGDLADLAIIALSIEKLMQRE